MGDYNVQIISAKLKRIDDDKLDEFKIEIQSRMPLLDSAYHATSPFISVSNWHHCTNLSMIVQAKYNRGVEEFLDWLRPMVLGGMGPGDAWSINFSEYSKEPRIEYLHPEWEEDTYG